MIILTVAVIDSNCGNHGDDTNNHDNNNADDQHL